jgi:hypothetical protein
MHNDDGTQTKNPDKDRVVAAISALKEQGSDINPYTVSGEAQVPRSTLYRNPELMDLINRERSGESADRLSNDEVTNKIAELEENNQALNETIWDLEKQLESLTKLKQDAYVQGFQAGIEEAAKRNAVIASELNTASFQPAAETAQTIVAEPDLEAQSSYEPPIPVAAAQELGVTNYSDPPSNGEGKGNLRSQIVETSTGDFEPLTSVYDFGRSPNDSHFAEEFQFGGGSLTAQDPDLSELTNVVQERHLAHSPVTELEETASAHSQPISSEDVADALSQQIEAEDMEPAYTSREMASKEANAQGKSETPHATATKEHINAEHEVHQALRDPDGIYNIARSGPTISSSAYNPLVELSWKDLQTVYNFSVASLKDYAKPGFGYDPGPMGGTNFADKSTQERTPSFVPPEADVTSDQLDRLEPSGPDPDYDPRRTGDRLQAFSDPRNLLDSEPIVDLDALDIFDDLDDYVDLDKIEIMSDVITKPSRTEEPSMGGDELRELIKGRIKQAADIPHEPTAPRTTSPPPAAGAAASKDEPGAKGAGPRNKFVGGAKPAQDPPVVSNFVVKSIPPEIRKACMILGLKPEEATQRSVIDAWKKQIASPGVHPDLGGDTEAAVFLNTAKDTLVRWLDAQAPKLGKKFGHKDPPKDKDS